MSLVSRHRHAPLTSHNRIFRGLQVESGDKLTLVEQEGLGVCGAECKTIAKAAEEVLGDRDTDLGELLWKVRCWRSRLGHLLQGRRSHNSGQLGAVSWGHCCKGAHLVVQLD